MQHDLVLKNALVVAPSGVFRRGVAVDGEEIVAERPSGRFVPQVVRPRGLA